MIKDIFLYFTIAILLINFSVLIIYYIPKKIYNSNFFNSIRNISFFDIFIKIFYIFYSFILLLTCFSIVISFIISFESKEDIEIKNNNWNYCFRFVNRINDSLILFTNSNCKIRTKDYEKIILETKKIKNIYINNNILYIILPKSSKYNIIDKNIVQISDNNYKIINSDDFGGIKYLKIEYVK